MRKNPQDVVDAVGREMFGHLDISALPPRVTVSGHGLPVVRGKAPVLAREREGIGWCTCRTAEIEIMLFRPRFDRTTGDADGNIPLEHHPTPPRMGSDFAELRVQKIIGRSNNNRRILDLRCPERRFWPRTARHRHYVAATR